eukprot:8966237-Pyramimonas_sp.AAC.1
MARAAFPPFLCSSAPSPSSSTRSANMLFLLSALIYVALAKTNDEAYIYQNKHGVENFSERGAAPPLPASFPGRAPTTLEPLSEPVALSSAGNEEPPSFPAAASASGLELLAT